MFSLHPHLSFDGQAREALEYYQQIFGGTTSFTTYGEYGVQDAPPEQIIHGELETDNFTIMGADDTTDQTPTWQGQRTTLTVQGENMAQLTKWYEAFAKDGTVTMAFEHQPWGDHYGDLTDKFGIKWAFSVMASS